MTSLFQPHLIQAANADERMHALGEFMEFWLGPRKQSYGVPAAHLNKHSLPAPLHWLHAFAGSWPALKDGLYSDGKGRALCCQDCLRPVNKLTFSESGKLEFLDENQGCFVCRTLPDADDPPVWCEGELYDSKQNFIEGETLVCDSLSKFLVTFTLQELALGARFILEDSTLKKNFKSAKKGKAAVWLKGETADPRTSNFWLWNGSLVAELSRGDWYFAANHPQAIEFLESKQGTITIMEFEHQREKEEHCWKLSVNKDGSACACYREFPAPAIRVVYPEPVKATAPKGTFNLAEVHRSISSRLKRRGNESKDVCVYIYHTGQDAAAAKYLSDLTLFEDLFLQTVAASSKGSLKLKRLFSEKWQR